jgi:hypothetical protein
MLREIDDAELSKIQITLILMFCIQYDVEIDANSRNVIEIIAEFLLYDLVSLFTCIKAMTLLCLKLILQKC